MTKHNFWILSFLFILLLSSLYGNLFNSETEKKKIENFQQDSEYLVYSKIIADQDAQNELGGGVTLFNR